MLINKVRLAGESMEKPYSIINQEEAELVDKALYTGHAVFWENGVTVVGAGYPELNRVPGNNTRLEDSLD